MVIAILQFCHCHILELEVYSVVGEMVGHYCELLQVIPTICHMNQFLKHDISYMPIPHTFTLKIKYNIPSQG
jgi:hypothetical protein